MTRREAVIRALRHEECGILPYHMEFTSQEAEKMVRAAGDPDFAAKTVVKVVLDRDDGALYFSRAPIPCDRDHEPDLSSGLFVRHLGIYAYRGAFLRRYVAEPPCALEKTEKLEQLRALWMGAKIAVVRTEDEGVGVDTPEDAERVEKLLLSRNG